MTTKKLLFLSTLLTCAATIGLFGQIPGLPGYAQAENAVPVILESGRPYYKETQAGDYLSSYYAQRHQDWQTASKYVARVLETDPDNPDLLKRSMLLSMGSGKSNQAIAVARKMLASEQDKELALLFISIDAFARQDYKEAAGTIEQLPEGSVAEFMQPILLAWAHSPEGKVDVSKFMDNSLHAYYALLLTDYLGKPNEAVFDYAETTLKQSDVDAYELEKIADIYARSGKIDKALDFYKIIQAQRPQDEGINAKIEILETGDKNINNLLSFTPVHSPEEGAAEAMFDMARIMYSEYSDESVIIFARLALMLNPDLIEAKILLANVMARHERYDDAIDHYTSIDSDSEIYIDAQRNAADLMERAGEADEAVKLLKSLYDKHHDTDSLILIGDIYRRTEDFASAVEYYNKAAAKFADGVPAEYWQLLYVRGMAYERLGDMNKAEEDLTAALKYKPDHPYLLNYLGYSWAEHDKNLDQSLEMIRRAFQLRPADGYIADSLGWVLYRMNRFEEAVPNLEKAVELLPYDPVINDHLGDAYWQVGRKMEAKFQWRRTLNHAEEETLKQEVQAKLDSGMKIKEGKQIREAKTKDRKEILKP